MSKMINKIKTARATRAQNKKNLAKKIPTAVMRDMNRAQNRLLAMLNIGLVTTFCIAKKLIGLENNNIFTDIAQIYTHDLDLTTALALVHGAPSAMIIVYFNLIKDHVKKFADDVLHNEPTLDEKVNTRIVEYQASRNPKLFDHVLENYSWGDKNFNEIIVNAHLEKNPQDSIKVVETFGEQNVSPKICAMYEYQKLIQEHVK